MLHRLSSIFIALCALAFGGCIEYGAPALERFDVADSSGLFILNEGNFMYGNASLSYYDFGSGECMNDVFMRANGAKLGDVAQSMTIHGGKGYVVVNNSGAIYVLDLSTFEVCGIIRGLVSPRYIHFVSDEKAYVTDLYAARISVVDPRTNAVVGSIDTGVHKSTERMVQYGRYVFVCCWSYDDTILVVDSQTDEIVREIAVGRQPDSMVLDRNGRVWCLCGGGLSADAQASLWRIDAETQRVDKVFYFAANRAPSELCIDGGGENLYFLDDDVMTMPVDADALPQQPLIDNRGTIYYGLAVDPHSGDIYVADAVDYVQDGTVYRYTRAGVFVDSFRVGITPGAFCFKYSD